MTHVKICCIQDEAEVRLAVSLGAAAVGLVSAMPSGPGPIPDGDIARIARTVPAGIHSFLLTSRRSAAAIAGQLREAGTTAVQIVDEPDAGAHALLRELAPAAKLVQVIHVTGHAAVDTAVRVAPLVDAILLDSGRPHLAVRELGGTGRTHDWTISRRIRELVQVPVILAGGLRAENVAEAIDAVAPYAVDVCSGVRTGSRLDEDRLRRFFLAAGTAADGTVARMAL
jgi:phosphoribosylanthranilate isomerase